ncbi:protease-4 [Runella defluvii]|uniref:Protease-4 n=1 Tax=Runella defluvii TaxID=370973 RepID=A0A7W6ETU4_9BACT|nr:S49 family peptidase [Runella defluvii]MBB3842220.1 protease-4 [Runella defluvii]
MTRERLLAERHLAMEDAHANAILNSQTVNFNFAKIEEPKVEFFAAENTYSEWELNWMGIGTNQVKSGLVAVLPVRGSLSPDWSWGGTNTEWLARQLDICVGNPLVSAIVLAGDSGGGTVNGTALAANAVKDANAEKPVLGYVKGLVASAAYWIFSQTSEIYLSSGVSSAVGSIGVMGVYISQAEALQKAGMDVRVLRSKGAEDKFALHPAEKINEDALAEEQKIIDAMRVEFWNAVQAGRPQITSDPGGKLYYGREAIKAGLANEVGTLTDVIKRADYLARKRASSIS